MKAKQLLFGHFLTLCFGSIIYLFLRTTGLKMFHWFDAIGILKPLLEIRQDLIPARKFPEWFLFALPDGLWTFSYMSLILFIWKNTICKQNMIWLACIPFAAISSEALQFLKLIPGTYDNMDLIMYLLGTGLPFIIYKKTITTNLK